MVKQSQGVVVEGVSLSGAPQNAPVLLQVNNEDFPAAFLRDLSAIGKTQLSSAQVLPAAAASPATLYQPVARVFHLALVQLSCESPGYPRLDPGRVLSAGLVIRQIPWAGAPANASWPWMKNSNGQFAWTPRDPSQADSDPDPARRPQPPSGQPALDQLLAARMLSSALTEVTTPAYVAAPNVCNAAGRTLVYALIPTASSQASTQQAVAIPPFDAATLTPILPTLLKAGKHCAPQPDNTSVNYQWMSDEYVKGITPSATDFLVFSTTLRMLYTVFVAFDNSSGANALLAVLNRHSVSRLNGSGYVLQPMGDFYREAAAKLIDYDPNVDAAPAPTLTMPNHWDYFSDKDEQELLKAMTTLLQARGAASSVPQGRFQDATRLYRARLFFRVKSETPGCPPDLIWSSFSDPFRIAAWYESSGRAVAPIPLPDPFDRNVLKNANRTSMFAVPNSLMNALGGMSLKGLQDGSGPSPGGGGLGVTWICGFSIPLVTICAFIVLSIFISLLNIVFFWIAFIKICIPIPKK